jgi:DNA-binding transcriptional regulator YiaG
MAGQPKTLRKSAVAAPRKNARQGNSRAGSTAARNSRAPLAASQKPPAVLQLRQKLGVNRQVFSRLSQFSERAIAKWETGEPLSAPSQQRMVELQRLQQSLSRVMRDDSVAQWLQTPNTAFAGLKPLEVVERGEIDRLWRMIYLMESGAPS